MPIYEPQESRRDPDYGWVYFGECDKCGYAQEWGQLIVNDVKNCLQFLCLDCIDDQERTQWRSRNR